MARASPIPTPIPAPLAFKEPTRLFLLPSPALGATCSEERALRCFAAGSRAWLLILGSDRALKDDDGNVAECEDAGACVCGAGAVLVDEEGDGAILARLC